MCNIGGGLIDNADPLGLVHKRSGTLTQALLDPLKLKDRMKPKAPEPAAPLATPTADAANANAKRQASAVLATSSQEEAANPLLNVRK